MKDTIQRTITPYLKKLATQFPAVAIMGPRQSGKTTLAQETFPEYAYVTLEDVDKKLAAKEDPRNFLSAFLGGKGVIFDEIQEVPELLSYMQGIIDQQNKPGFFILTGSQHFLLYEKITQTLAGRIALFTLLPLSIDELTQAQLLPESVELMMLKGGYPRVYAQDIDMQSWYSNYIGTYVEKDVRQIIQVSDTLNFQRFLKLCAARTGNLLNYADLARDCDISPHTAKSWISILVTGFIITLVSPYYHNFSKRLVKSPKIYFYDTSLVCALLGIKTVEELSFHPMRGAIFESLIMSEIFKYYHNHNKRPNVYLWRDMQGHEIDCIIEKMYGTVIPIEIKSSKTMNNDFFKGIRDWSEIAAQTGKKSYVIYAGEMRMGRNHTDLIPWSATHTALAEIEELPTEALFTTIPKG